MINWRRPTQSHEITQWVECYWFIEKELGDNSHPFPKLNPDPSGTLIIAPDNQPYSYQNNAQLFNGQGDHWIFPNSQTFQLDHSEPFLIIGIKFHVGLLSSLDLEPRQPVIDHVEKTDTTRYFNALTFNKNSLFHLAKTQPAECVAMLDQLIGPWLTNTSIHKDSEFCRQVTPILGNQSLSNIGERLHCSQRTVERRFIKATGLTLKQCQSMYRFEAMLARLHSLGDDRVNWQDLVDEFGFSDQPHLIRYLKSMIGVSPGQYLSRRDLTIDTYGSFE